ncbi:S1C family serine protease [Aggregatilinea lenta]|uniref:S1C family serine protease n=1 Tax=Aggregatilinea lenta TaxID=913108 RepID=UPI000E5AA367|nr:trypsin-like peptidase domain-containing protein [Aggregatilinea lenta]
MVKRRIFYGATTIALAVVVLLSVFLVSGTGTSVQGATLLQATSTPLPVMAIDSASASSVAAAADTVIEQLYNEVSPSVVSINVVATQQGNGYFPGSTVSGTGSGFVVDTEGHIVTNNHVVEGATDIEVNFVDGTIVRGTVVGTDANSDLAVIQVDLPADQLHPVTFADSDALTIGQSVLAIGSPFGQRWTLTTGIISGLERTIDGLNNFSIGGVIQTDAAINPGNSGGPLLDLNGAVIGVNSQIMSESGSNSGVGFTIPSNLVQRVAQELIANGEVEYSYLGIEGGDISLAIIEALDLPSNQQGVVVSNVQSGGPAEQAGLRSATIRQQNMSSQEITGADIITAIDGTPLNGMESLISYLANHTSPGQKVTLTVLRGGHEQSIEVTLGQRPSSAA